MCPHLKSLSSETVSQCHPEALAEGSRFYKRLESLDSSPAAQNDIHAVSALRHTLLRERVSKLKWLKSNLLSCAELMDSFDHGNHILDGSFREYAMAQVENMS